MSNPSIQLQNPGEIEEFYLETTGMKPDYLQLSRGRAGLSLKVDELDGISLVWAAVDGKSQWRDVTEGPGLHIACLTGGTGTVTTMGNVMQADNCAVYVPGREVEYVMDGPCVTLEVGVADWLAQDLGWQVSGEPFRQVRGAVLNQLRMNASFISRALNQPGSADQSSRQLALRDSLLQSIENLLQPWVSDSDRQDVIYERTASYELVKKAESVFEAMGAEDFSVDEMIRLADVPRRTFFHAFRKALGLGPRRYFELVRLNKLRKRLKQADKVETSVTVEATNLGFSNLGRMAALYRDQFGENPRATLSKTAW